MLWYTLIQLPHSAALFVNNILLLPEIVQRPCRAFEVSTPVSLSALNTSGWADGAQMDSKVGMSLKIHGTHHDQGEWRGVGIKH